MAVISMTCIPTSFLSGFFGLFALAPPNEVGFFGFLLLNDLALLPPNELGLLDFPPPSELDFFAFLPFDGLEAAMWLL